MTESQWNTSQDPAGMLAFLRTTGLSERKAGSFAVACCRRIWDVVDGDNRRLGEVIERYADGQATAEEMQAAVGEAHDNDWTAALAFEEAASLVGITDAAEHSAGNAAHAYADHHNGYPAPTCGSDGVFRWTDPALSQPEERALPSGHLNNQRLAVLADMLEEAGCRDEEVLGHLRKKDAVHVRGCFVVDLLTSKG